MVSKPRKTAKTSAKSTTATPEDWLSNFGQPGQSHNIWLAGLGALAKAQADGSKAFEALVKQGIEMQAQTQALAKEHWEDAAKRMGAMTTGAPGATGGWDRLGGIFENRVARALSSMGMPPADEIAELKTRIDKLEQALAELQAATAKKPGANQP